MSLKVSVTTDTAEDGMIIRTWRGWTRHEEAGAYAQTVSEAGIALPEDDRFSIESEITVKHFTVY